MTVRLVFSTRSAPHPAVAAIQNGTGGAQDGWIKIDFSAVAAAGDRSAFRTQFTPLRAGEQKAGEEYFHQKAPERERAPVNSPAAAPVALFQRRAIAAEPVGRLASPLSPHSTTGEASGVPSSPQRLPGQSGKQQAITLPTGDTPPQASVDCDFRNRAPDHCGTRRETSAFPLPGRGQSIGQRFIGSRESRGESHPPAGGRITLLAE